MADGKILSDEFFDATSAALSGDPEAALVNAARIAQRDLGIEDQPDRQPRKTGLISNQVCTAGCTHLRIVSEVSWNCDALRITMTPPGCSTGCTRFERAAPPDPTLDLHRDIAARLGKGCARKRWDYYRAAAALADQQRARLDAVARVYGERMADAPEEECEDDI